MKRARDFLRSRGGTVCSLTLLLLGAVALVVSIRASFGPSSAARLSARRTFICAQTGKAFEHQLRIGDEIPVFSPYSKALTGYPAEFCYWNPDGTVKDRPTAVLLNHFKGLAGPTRCPECGRIVVAHNPVPRPGESAPSIEDHARTASARIRTARRD